MAYGAESIIVKREDDTTGVYEIKGEDHSLGSLIEQALLSIDGVVSARYENPHPLQDVIVVTVRTDGSIKPREALEKALEKIIRDAREFLELYKKELESRGVDVGEWG